MLCKFCELSFGVCKMKMKIDSTQIHVIFRNSKKHFYGYLCTLGSQIQFEYFQFSEIERMAKISLEA